MQNGNMKRTLCAALAAVLAAGLLAGCGGKQDPVQETAPPAAESQPNDAQQEYLDALEREEQEKMDAAKEELDRREGNTKPAGDAAGAPNKGDGTGMAGLGDDAGDGADEEEDGGDAAAGSGDGTEGLPDGMPELTMDALGVPEWSGQPWAMINGGTPYFSAPESRPREAESYSSLDTMRRPGSALCVFRDRRNPMADYAYEIKKGTLSVPGWGEDAYPGIVDNLPEGRLPKKSAPADGKLMYMRRLMGSGIGTLELGRKNSMVCTEYMGEYGLRSLEEAVLRYIERTRRRVIYRVTPVFEGNEAVARGAVVEAMSWGDSAADIGAGRDLCFNMFVYNVQPGVTINYMTGATDVDDSADPNLSSTQCGAYVLDTARRQAHVPECSALVTDVVPSVQSFWYGRTADLAAWSMDWNSCDCMADLYAPSVAAVPEEPDEPEGSGQDGWQEGGGRDGGHGAGVSGGTLPEGGADDAEGQ